MLIITFGKQMQYILQAHNNNTYKNCSHECRKLLVESFQIIARI